jgi:hypothetical protein
MVKETKTKINEYRSRHTIYFQKDFVSDSSFPFKVGEEIIAKIQGDKVILEKNG